MIDNDPSYADPAVPLALAMIAALVVAVPVAAIVALVWWFWIMLAALPR